MKFDIIHFLDTSNNTVRLYLYQILGKIVKTETTRAAIELQKEILKDIADRKNKFITVDVRENSFLHKNDYIIKDIFSSRGFFVKSIEPKNLLNSQIAVHELNEDSPPIYDSSYISKKIFLLAFIFLSFFSFLYIIIRRLNEINGNWYFQSSYFYFRDFFFRKKPMENSIGIFRGYFIYTFFFLYSV